MKPYKNVYLVALVSSNVNFKTTIKPGSHNSSNHTWVAFTSTVLAADVWITCSGGQHLRSTIHSIISSPLMNGMAVAFRLFGFCFTTLD